MVDITLPMKELRKYKLMVATPMYGGQCTGTFTKAMMELQKLCHERGIEFDVHFLFNESLITRARNYCVASFLNDPRGFTHLMFIDSDIGFTARDVIALMALTIQDEKYDIIGGPYPKKTISWEKVKVAVDKGMADEDPNRLERFVGDYVFNAKGGGERIPMNEPVEVLEIGTGFMMIPRKTFDKFAAGYPQYWYRPDHIRTKDFDGTKKIFQYFQAEIDPKSERYLSEDYWFTQKAQEIGMRCWLCPFMSMTHMGSYLFGGSLADLASIQVSPTADPRALKKKQH